MQFINKQRLVDLFCDLARIKSPSGDEAEIAEVLLEKLKKIGLSARQDGYGNVIASLSGRGIPIVLCAHMDTVQIGVGSEIVPIINRDRITSDGTTILGADNKDAIASILEALSVIQENSLDHRAVEVIFTRQEEDIAKGAKNLDLNLFSGRECIIADSPEPYGTVVYGAPFCYRFKVRIEGRRAHTRDPREGVNVVKIFSRAVSVMPLGYIDEFTTSNISYQVSGLAGVIDGEQIFERATVEGGMKENLPGRLERESRNTVPDLAFAFGEVRGLKQDLVLQALKEIAASFESSAREFGGQISFEQILLADGYLLDKENDPLVVLARRIFRDQGFVISPVTSRGGSDANMLCPRGVKTVVVGSAYRNFHEMSEYVVIDDMVRLTDFFIRVATAP